MELNLNNLINVNRFSGTPLLRAESVSDHVWGMIALALEHVPEINKKRNKLALKEINIKELIYKIALHDLDEAFYCDIPRPFKHRNEFINNAINTTANEILREKLPTELFNDVISSKDHSLEGLYVELLDSIQCGLKMKFELDLGNRFMLSELPNIIDVLDYFLKEFENVDWHQTEFEFVKSYRDELNKYLDA